ncbi:MAG: copper resistance protein NlpE [Sphingobacteriaceae bacterium]
MMKKMLFPICTFFSLLAACSSQSTFVTGTPTDNIVSDNGIAGTYGGSIPCADCSGILYKLVLKADSTYQESMVYQGGSNPSTINNKGNWRFKTTAVVELLGKTEGNNLFSAGDHQLIMLDMNGQVISGPTKDLYVLQKE